LTGANTTTGTVESSVVSGPPNLKKGNLLPFMVGEARARRLGRKGGSVVSTNKRLKNMLKHSKLAHNVSPKACLELVEILLNEGKYRQFLATELMELAVLSDNYVQEKLRKTIWRDPQGNLHRNYDSEEREKALKVKMRLIELVLKAGFALHPGLVQGGRAQVQAVQINLSDEQPKEARP